MSNRKSKSLSTGSFEQIESAVRETERGRWFLDEYARRHANPDTRELLGSLRRIERALAGRPATGADMASLTERLIEARTALPGIAQDGGRIAAETLMATETLDGLSALEPELLATSGSRMALGTETDRLREMAVEQRDVYARLANCAAKFEALEAELLSGIVLPQVPDETPAAIENLDYFAPDEDLFTSPAPAESHLKLVPPSTPVEVAEFAQTQPATVPEATPAAELALEPEVAAEPEKTPEPIILPGTPAFTGGEKRRIVILRGNAQPPVPEGDEPSAPAA